MVSERFKRMLLPALENEGVRKGKSTGYSNNSYDVGGKTIFGISRNYWKRDYDAITSLWKQELKEKAYQLVEEFYDTHFWNHLYNDINDESLCFKLFDFGINGGKNTAILLLQQTLNKYFKCKLIEDAVFGGNTLFAINTAENFDISKNRWFRVPLIEKESKLYSAFVHIVVLWYKERKTFWHFGRGWFNRLRKIYNENRDECGRIKWKIVVTKAF